MPEQVNNLYSLNGREPQPLPNEIKLSSGFTRTNSSTFTEAELSDAGWTGPYTKPEYDTDSHTIKWDSANLEFVLTEVEPWDEMTHDRIWNGVEQKYEITRKSDEEILNGLKDVRNQVLADCDWTQLPDCQLSAIEIQAYKNFRQTLRDMFVNYVDYESVVWPSYTSELESLQQG